MYLSELRKSTLVGILQMVNIRRCGHKDGFFFMELGRHSPTGSGELWMQVDDAYIAQSMHEVLLR
jgi:insulin receptor substrate 1